MRILYWPFRRTLSTLTILSVIVLITTSYLPNSPTVNASGATLLISPSSQPLASTNSIISYNVRVSSMDSFNAWDIMLNTNDTVLDATSLSINGNLLSQFGHVSELTNCVNGGIGIPTDQPGNLKCTIDDGPGRVHSAAVLFQNSSPPGSSGLLFNITFKAQSGPGTPLIIFKDTLANAGQALTYSLQQGVYGYPQSGFFMDVNPQTFQAFQGGWRRVDVRLTGYGGFNANVKLSASIPSPVASMVFTPNPVPLTSGATLISAMNVSTTLSSPVNTYFIITNATGGGISHSSKLTLVIQPAQQIALIKDFSISAPSATTGDHLTVSTTISNVGTIPGSPMTLVISWQGFVVSNHTITLQPNESKNYADTWYTSGYPPANSTLQAQILGTNALKRINFVLDGPPSTPFYLDPLFLGVATIMVGAPSFLYMRRRIEQNSKKKRNGLGKRAR